MKEIKDVADRATYTQGPWTATHRGGDELSVEGPNGEIVIGGCGCCGSPFGINLEHDAPLIAAAPALVEALKKCSARLEVHMVHTEDLIAHMESIAALRAAGVVLP